MSALQMRGGDICQAIGVGLACASLQMLGPDHICTLMSLGATTSRRGSLHVGGAWGLAHSVGTVAICVLLQVFRTSMHVDVQMWEHVGDYLIGWSLVLCAIYFAIRESHYLVENADGSLTIRTCECHSGAPGSEGVPLVPDVTAITLMRRDRPRRFMGKKGKTFADSYTAKQCSKDWCEDAECEMGIASRKLLRLPMHSLSEDLTKAFEAAVEAGEHESCETAPLLGDQTTPTQLANSLSSSWLSGASSWIGGAVLGFIQGLCCPMALVSANFLAYVTTVPTMSIFLVTYILASVLGSALFAYAWSRLMARGGKLTSPLAVYRGSCVVTLVFGLCWIAANRFDDQHQANYLGMPVLSVTDGMQSFGRPSAHV